MSTLKFEYELLFHYKLSDILDVINNPDNYKKIIESCTDIELNNITKNNNGFDVYDNTLQISTPFNYVYIKSKLEQTSPTEVQLILTEKGYLDEFKFKWLLNKKDNNNTIVKLEMKLLFSSYIIQNMTIYSRKKIIKDLISNFVEVLENEFGVHDKSYEIISKKILY
tara:strand:- start:92 stop:592 length:501 start_codon:yes stop_codon:yes gene_type:complete